MIIVRIIAAAAPTAAHSLRRWIFHLGGLGLIPLGLLDSSLIPVPGSLDVVTILLAAREQEWWFYYALMATAGSVIGAYFTYRLGRKGGKETLERKVKRRQVENIDRIFERWGFGAIAIPALLPPPVPMVPFVLAAGAMQYPMKKFLAAFTLGRIVRYTTLAYLAARYGRKIIAIIAEHGYPVALTAIGLMLVTALVVFIYWRGIGSRKRATS